MKITYELLLEVSWELECALLGGRINKITMPSPQVVCLDIRSNGENFCLLLSAESGLARAHLTLKKPEPLSVPPAVCMFLRKRLTGGIIEKISLLNEDRILCLKIISSNELNDKAEFNLICEIMGGQSNIILTDNCFTVLDALKRITSEGKRIIFPNVKYEAPIKHFAGQNDSAHSAESIKNSEFRIQNCGKDSAHSAQRTAHSEGLINKESAPMPVAQIPMPLNKQIDSHFTSLQESSQKKQHGKNAQSILKRLLGRNAKSIQNNEEIIKNGAEIERILQIAEILKCNIHNLTGGKSILSCADFYNSCEIDISVDPLLSPKENVAKYFKKYKKLKGAYAYAEAKQKPLEGERSYLMSVSATLLNAETREDFLEIEEELSAHSGAIIKNSEFRIQNEGNSNKKSALASCNLQPATSKNGKNKNSKKLKKPLPLSLNINGFTVLVGKNNLQNDEVLRLSSGNDIWLHVKGYHGAHVAIIANGKPVPKEVIEQSATLALKYSELKSTEKCEVDYTLRKNVKKLGKPGLVSYTGQKTILILQ
ncbi:MAG: NFACT RNA binding domain-containing protein [Firmicutes bacterium]|nr:NFACT RNA binding domain-containing protein [Bacillota bacterium]